MKKLCSLVLVGLIATTTIISNPKTALAEGEVHIVDFSNYEENVNLIYDNEISEISEMNIYDDNFFGKSYKGALYLSKGTEIINLKVRNHSSHDVKLSYRTDNGSMKDLTIYAKSTGEASIQSPNHHEGAGHVLIFELNSINSNANMDVNFKVDNITNLN